MDKQTKKHKIVLNIPDDIFQRANSFLRIKGVGVKEYLIDFLEKMVSVKEKNDYSNDSIWTVINLGQSKKRDISVKHDKYLYGTAKK